MGLPPGAEESLRLSADLEGRVIYDAENDVYVFGGSLNRTPDMSVLQGYTKEYSTRTLFSVGQWHENVGFRPMWRVE